MVQLVVRVAGNSSTGNSYNTRCGRSSYYSGCSDCGICYSGFSTCSSRKTEFFYKLVNTVVHGSSKS